MKVIAQTEIEVKVDTCEVCKRQLTYKLEGFPGANMSSPERQMYVARCCKKIYWGPEV